MSFMRRREHSQIGTAKTEVLKDSQSDLQKPQKTFIFQHNEEINAYLLHMIFLCLVSIYVVHFAKKFEGLNSEVC